MFLLTVLPSDLMESDYYEYRTDRGILSLHRSRDLHNCWDLRLNGEVVRSGYTDPNQAAFEVGNHDFGISELDELFRHVYVPSDLRSWRTSSHVYRRDSNPV